MVKYAGRRYGLEGSNVRGNNNVPLVGDAAWLGMYPKPNDPAHRPETTWIRFLRKWPISALIAIMEPLTCYLQTFRFAEFP